MIDQIQQIQRSAAALWQTLRFFVETFRARGETDEQIDARLAEIDPQFTTRKVDARGPLAFEDPSS